MQIHLAGALCFGAAICAAAPSRTVVESAYDGVSGAEVVEDRSFANAGSQITGESDSVERNPNDVPQHRSSQSKRRINSIWTLVSNHGRHSSIGSPEEQVRDWLRFEKKASDIQAPHKDYKFVVENSIGMPVTHQAAAETSNKNDHHLLEDGSKNGKWSSLEEGGNYKAQDDRLDLTISPKYHTVKETYHPFTALFKSNQPSLPDFPSKPINNPINNPISQPATKKPPTKNHQTHPTHRIEDLDDNSTFEDLLKDWNLPDETDISDKRTSRKNSPYLHTLYPAKELSIPQSLYFSKLDEERANGERGEKRFYVYEVVEGDTLEGVARKLGVGLGVVVGAEPLWVDGEFE